tara:strand:- start:382 stop:549 length:168 start_codon:yes stop_codon:yes gene_type:complete
MKNLKISNLWQKKPKQPTLKNKPVRLPQNSAQYVQDDTWHMSPEDALRVSYSGHK